MCKVARWLRTSLKVNNMFIALCRKVFSLPIAFAMASWQLVLPSLLLSYL